jgi:hypothetical protein
MAGGERRPDLAKGGGKRVKGGGGGGGGGPSALLSIFTLVLYLFHVREGSADGFFPSRRGGLSFPGYSSSFGCDILLLLTEGWIPFSPAEMRFVEWGEVGQVGVGVRDTAGKRGRGGEKGNPDPIQISPGGARSLSMLVLEYYYTKQVL